MPILYLTTSTPPKFADTDAVLRQVATLQREFGGEMISIAGPRKFGFRLPRQVLGLHCLAAIRQAETRSKLTHLFHPVPYCFPFLRLLRNPIVFTVTASVAESAVPTGLGFLRKINRFVVSNRRDEQILKEWGIAQVEMILPGVDLDRYSDDVTTRLNPMAGDAPVRLLMASAPWSEKQFDEKGVDALLGAAALSSQLHLTILLRGLLEKELRKRIRRLRVESRVEVVNEKVDIRDYLRRADAVVLAAKRPDVITAYPHSLLEALAAARPVIMSNAMPMADLVRELGAGVIIEEVNANAIVAAAEAIRKDREYYLKGVRRFDPTMFSIAKMTRGYRAVYDSAAGIAR